MANYIHLTGNDNPIPPYTIIYKKQTNNFGGWSYVARPEAEDSKFYELNGVWLYVVKDRDELLSLRNQGTWMTSTDPNQLVSITDKDSITKSIPMNNLVTTRINYMESMFYNKSSFNQYIGNWDVSNVNDMRYMFQQSSFNQPIGNWDVSNVLRMDSMFNGSSFNQYIGNWNVSNVDRMDYMFYNSSFDQDIGSWYVRNVRNMQGMFKDNVVFNQDLSSWCVSGLTVSHSSFDTGATNWTLPKPNFDNPPC